MSDLLMVKYLRGVIKMKYTLEDIKVIKDAVDYLEYFKMEANVDYMTKLDFIIPDLWAIIEKWKEENKDG